MSQSASNASRSTQSARQTWHRDHIAALIRIRKETNSVSIYNAFFLLFSY